MDKPKNGRIGKLGASAVSGKNLAYPLIANPARWL
jgi:hypothetical protein